MSACISRHGEYGEHTPDADWTCTLCGDVDTAGLRAEVDRLRHENADLRRSRDERKATERRRRTEDREAWMREHGVEVKRLRAGIESLADWHETKAEKAERFRPEVDGENRVMDKAAQVHRDADARLRALLNPPTEGETDER